MKGEEVCIFVSNDMYLGRELEIHIQTHTLKSFDQFIK